MLILTFLNNILALLAKNFSLWNRITILMSGVLRSSLFITYNYFNRFNYNGSWLFLAILGSLFIFIYFAGICNSMYRDESLLLFLIFIRIQKNFFLFLFILLKIYHFINLFGLIPLIFLTFQFLLNLILILMFKNLKSLKIKRKNQVFIDGSIRLTVNHILVLHWI